MMFFGTVISFVLFLSLQSALSFSPKSIRRNEVVFNREKLHDRLSSLRAGAVDLSLHDAAISILVASESIVWLKVWTSLATNGFLDSKITRKIIHTGSAPLFIAHWPLYSNLPTAKYFAAAVPLIQVLRLDAINMSTRFNLLMLSILVVNC